MKINEAVDIINGTTTVKANHCYSDIFVCSKWKSFDECFLMIHDHAKTWGEVTLASIAMDDVIPEDLARVMGVVQRLLDTPVKDRFPEKKWLLCLGKNDYGKKIYLTKINDPRKVETMLNADCFTEWSNQEIQGLVERFPSLAPAIDGMKEEVDDDEKQN